METKPLPIDNPLLPIMERLKRETQTQHSQIEQVRTMKRLFATDYSLTEYRQHLEKMYGFLRVIEPLLLPHMQEASLHYFFSERSKQAWLMQDLSHFGLTPAQILALPQCPTPTYVNHFADALGVYYVLEGSSLGGQFIFKQLQHHFGEAGLDKLRFYQGYGEQTRLNWQQFSELLTARFAHQSEVEVTQVITSAKLTFDLLAQWLTDESFS